METWSFFAKTLWYPYTAVIVLYTVYKDAKAVFWACCVWVSYPPAQIQVFIGLHTCLLCVYGFVFMVFVYIRDSLSMSWENQAVQVVVAGSCVMHI